MFLLITRPRKTSKALVFFERHFFCLYVIGFLLINSVTFSSHPVNAITRFEVSNLVFTVINNNKNNNNNKE